MKKDEDKLSFLYAMFWFLNGLVWWIVGQLISNKPLDIFLIASISISTIISASLSYLIANRSFKKISLMRYFCLVIPLSIVFMVIIGIILNLLGFITI